MIPEVARRELEQPLGVTADAALEQLQRPLRYRQPRGDAAREALPAQSRRLEEEVLAVVAREDDERVAGGLAHPPDPGVDAGKRALRPQRVA